MVSFEDVCLLGLHERLHAPARVFYLTRFLQSLEGEPRLVGTVQLEYIESLDVEAFYALFSGKFQVFDRVIAVCRSDSMLLSVEGIEVVSRLGGDNDLLFVRSLVEHLPYQFLGVAEAVDIGCVYECHPGIECGMNGLA